jgi:hypothetical protein
VEDACWEAANARETVEELWKHPNIDARLRSLEWETANSRLAALALEFEDAKIGAKLALLSDGAAAVDDALAPGTRIHATAIDLRLELADTQFALLKGDPEGRLHSVAGPLRDSADWFMECIRPLISTTTYAAIQARREHATRSDGSLPLPADALARPDFHLTQDIRATSDPLWSKLAAFRRRLMDGERHTPAEWHAWVAWIREDAHAAGLRPYTIGTIEYIAATLGEAIDGDSSGAWDQGPEVERMTCPMVFTDWGAGRIEVHDIWAGFADDSKRLAAIGWAESWMNARERQLCEVKAIDNPPDDPHDIFLSDDHLTVLCEIAGYDRLVKASELDGKSGMPKYDHLLNLLNGMEQTVPPLLHRPKQRSGWGVTAAGRAELVRRGLNKPPA